MVCMLLLVSATFLAAPAAADSADCAGLDIECPVTCNPTDIGRLLANPVGTVWDCLP